jgi:hypothetical protein
MVLDDISSQYAGRISHNTERNRRRADHAKRHMACGGQGKQEYDGADESGCRMKRGRSEKRQGIKRRWPKPLSKKPS